MAVRRSGYLALVLALVMGMLGAVPAAQAAEAGPSAEAVALQRDTFSRSVANGWGSAETGGAWRLSVSTGASVNGSEGEMFLPRGAFRTATLPGTVSGPLAATVSFAYPDFPYAGTTTTGLMVRRSGGSYYFPRIRVDRLGNAYLGVVARQSGGAEWLLTPEVRVGQVGSGTRVNLAVGSDVTAEGGVVAAAWRDDETRPDAWQVTARSGQLPTSGEVGLRFQSGVDTPGSTVLVDEFGVYQEQGNLAPTAEFTATTDGLFAYVDGSASSDPDGEIVGYSWDYGDGTSATGPTPPAKVYNAEGTFTITLTVTDDEGATGTTTREVAVAPDNAEPVAVFTATPDELQVAFDASESTDSDGAITSYTWDFGDGTTGSGVTFDKTYAGGGTYEVTLTVTDDRGASGTMTQDVTVTPNLPPEAKIIAPYRDLQVLLDGRLSQDPDGEIVSYEWDLGDGTTASGARLPVKTYDAPGTYTITLTVTDNKGVANTATKELTLGDIASSTAGAQLPIIYNISDLPGTVRYVSPVGSDESGTGTEDKPYRTLKKAVGASGAGDSVVLRGGTYDITGNALSIGKANLTITAYPGEVPVFDGSIAAPTTSTADGALQWITYQPMVAKPGEGLNISQLPTATFDGAGNPTGLAASRGWRCVSSSGYESFGVEGLERDTVIDIPYRERRLVRSLSGSGCPSGTTPKVITGFYPDQVWVDGRPLVQVLERTLVRPGTFYVPRDFSSDANPSVGRLYLSQQDAADLSKVRVSSSEGNFLHFAADGISLRGIRIQNHSPAWPFFATTVTSGIDSTLIEDVEYDSVASIAAKYAGGDASNQSGLGNDNTMNRVTINRAGWIGMSALYQDDLHILNTVIRESNPDREIATAPKSGAIKATKTHRMKVVNAEIVETGGHGLWWDQSNYDATLADSLLADNTDSALFYEISHGLTMVNNVVLRGGSTSSSPTLRFAGTSNVTLVNNTVVGGQVPLALAGDPRSKQYGSNNRPCAEHTQRYNEGGSIGSDCPPALTSDLDFARPGELGGGPNLTPGLDWRPSADVLVNNVFANPISGSGGICPGGWAFCVKGYAGSSGDPDVVLPTNQILKSDLIMDGNVYQTSDKVAEVLVEQGGSGGFNAATLDQLRSNLAGSYYNLAVEGSGLVGTGFVEDDGDQTPQLAARNNEAAPVPADPTVNEFLPAGYRWYGAKRETATGGNQSPDPAFDITQDGLSVDLDASASSDPDGTVAGYLWDFGDGSPRATGRTVSHTFADFGTYTVTLVVVDDQLALSALSKTITIVDPDEAFLARDSFDRTVASGLGTADVGGPWSLSGNSADYAVDGDNGVLKLRAGQSRRALLTQVASDRSEAEVTIGFSGSLSGSGVYASLMPRVMTDTSAYRAKVQAKGDGQVTLSLTRINASGAETSLKTASNVLKGLTAGDRLHIKTQAVGGSPTTIRAKVWIDGQAEPTGWQLETTDGTGGLQAAGGVGLFAYESSSATSAVDLQVDDLAVRSVG